MRQITHGDVTAAARVLMVLPEPDRPAAMARMIAEADLADRYRRALGRVHPCLGNGTLLAAALARPLGPEPFAGDVAYLRAMAHVIEALLDRHGGPGGHHR